MLVGIRNTPLMDADRGIEDFNRMFHSDLSHLLRGYNRVSDVIDLTLNLPAALSLRVMLIPGEGDEASPGEDAVGGVHETELADGVSVSLRRQSRAWTRVLAQDRDIEDRRVTRGTVIRRGANGHVGLMAQFGETESDPGLRVGLRHTFGSPP